MLIEICGIDGSGKSTLAAELKSRAIAAGRECYVRGFKSDYRLLLSRLANEHGVPRDAYFGANALELACALEFVQHHHVLYGLAAAGRALYIADRYTLSAFAMAIARGADNLAPLADVYRCARTPDLCVRLELQPEIAAVRALARPGRDLWVAREGIDWLYRFDQAFDIAASHLAYAPSVFDSAALDVAALADRIGEGIGLPRRLR